MRESPVILLVDDNQMDVELALNAFSNVPADKEIRVTSSGEEALDYLFGEGEFANRELNPIPDLLLLDLKMPGIDGFEVLRRVKETPVLKRLPVVVLTSSNEEQDRSLSYDCGANSYLVKPVSFAGFIDLVSKIHDYWLLLNRPATGIANGV